MLRVYRGLPVGECRLPTDRADWLAHLTTLSLILSATALGLHWPGAVVAAEEDSPAPLTLGTEQITATRGSRLTHDVAAAVTVIDQSEIEAAMPQVLPEALRGRVGTFFQQTTPGQGTAIIRGLKGSQVLHLVDGMRLNNAFFRSAPNQYLALVDPYSVARMEVVRGPSSTLYGADAMGGVVQVLTPEAHFVGTGWDASGRFYGSFASADQAKVARAEFEAGRRGLALSGGLTYQEYEDRETGSGTIVSPSGYRSKAADFKLIYGPSTNSEIMFSTQYLEQPNTPRVDELVPGFGQTQPSSDIFLFTPNRREFYHGRYRFTPEHSWFNQLEIHLAHQIITDDRRTQDFGSVLLANESNQSNLTGLTIQLDSSVTRDVTLTYGIEVYTDDIDSSRLQTDTQTGMTQAVAARFPDGSSMDSFSVYLNDEWRIATAWTFVAGIRYSQFDLELTDPSTGNNIELSPDDFTGNLSLSYHVTPSVNIVSNLGRGFRPPNIFDLGTLGPRPGNRFNIANPGLRPESVNSIDLGVKVLTGQVQLQAFVFYSEYNDKITSVATGAITPDGRTVVRSENLDEVTVSGFEMGARYDISNELHAYGVLNYTRGDEQSAIGAEQPADRIPPLNGKVGVVYAPAPELRIEPFVLFANEQDRLSIRDVNDPRINPAGTDEWATVNLHLDWRFAPRSRLGFRVENLFDNDYREHGSGIDARGLNIGVAIDTWF